MEEVRTYRLLILQKKEHPNPLEYLIDLFKDDQCQALISEPTRKSFRSIPIPGIKWIGGIVQLKNNQDCFIHFSQRTEYDEYFKIKRKKIKNS